MAKNNQRVWTIVTIITVILLIIIFSGVTYAYFSAFNNQGSTESISMTSGKMIITYADGKSSLLISKEIHPSDRIIIDKTFTLTGTNTTSGLAMPYKTGIKFKNEFSYNQLYYYIKRVSENENITAKLIGEANQTIPGHETETGYTKGTFIKNSDETYLELANGEFKANTNNQTITFNLKIQFPDNNENQDSEKGKSFTGYIVVNNEEETAVDYIVNLYNEEKENNGLMMDDTEDYNIRYSGSNPNNYVEFGNDGELWRIIGLFDIKDDANGEYQKKIKLIRNNSLGSYVYDSSDASINNGFGTSDWTTSKLKDELNGDYLDTTLTSSKYWYNGKNNQKQSIFRYEDVIKSKYQQMISTSLWNIGASKYSGQYPYNLFTKVEYENERGNLPYQNGKATTWVGKIALMYPSDYGYASTDKDCRYDLRSGIVYDGSSKLDYSNTKCKNNNWLSDNGSLWYTTLTAVFADPLSVFITYGDNGVITVDSIQYPKATKPTLYLSPNVKIISGTGTSTDPYILG